MTLDMARSVVENEVNFLGLYYHLPEYIRFVFEFGENHNMGEH